jgi:hypothetical protein
VPDEVLLIRMDCSSTRHPQVGRFVHHGHSWVLTGASRQRPGSSFDSGRSRDHGVRTGSFVTAADYPGCPSCKSHSFVRCSRCESLACWGESLPLFHCPTCGASGPVQGTIESLRGTGRD